MESSTMMMRILIVKPIIPYPPDQGTKVVTLNFLRVLSRHFEVSLVCGLSNREDVRHVEALRKYCKEVHTFLLPNRKSVFHAAFYKGLYTLKSWLYALPSEIYYCSPAKLSAVVADVTRSSDYDVVQFEYWYTAPAARFARTHCKVLLEHDVDFLRLERRLAVTEGSWDRRNLRRTISAVRTRETRAYGEFYKVLALSGTDSSLIEKSSGVKDLSTRLPVIVDCSKYAPGSDAKMPFSIVFLGALDADFNADAINYFCKEILPLVWAELPDARLFIVGRRPSERVRKLADGERVILRADVPDIVPHVSRCAVQVVPLRYGGGIRIRTLEGMAMGMAIVTTSVGVEGIGARPGRDLLVSNTAQDFAAKVVEVLRDSLLAAELGGRAREFVLSEHSEAAAESRIVEVYRELGEQARHRRSRVPARASGGQGTSRKP